MQFNQLKPCYPVMNYWILICLFLFIYEEENFDSLSLIFEKIALGSLYFFLHQQNLRMKSTFATDIVSWLSSMHVHIV